jgi:carbamoyl-phosphate synthase small subunit
MTNDMKLVLEDGSVFEGTSFGRKSPIAGEVVFNTGMVGYPESLTDPSYRGQILVLTYPLIGNYGVPAYREDRHGLPLEFESERIQVAGLVVTEYVEKYSHYSAARSLGKWLDSEGIPAISGVDTRAITRKLRDKGTMLGKLETGMKKLPFFDPNATDLVSQVSCSEVQNYQTDAADSSKAPTIILLDCGCKAHIIRSLLKRGLNIIRVPHDYYFLGMDFDGVMIANGPGDPMMARASIKNVEHALAVGKPILGICLGNQILSLAAGATTYKLKFGHRSQNQPCVEKTVTGSGRGRCVITSQNHGYAVRADGLPEDWEVWFENANDGSVEGIRHVTKPFRSVQFHPEATPGPTDSAWIFDEFSESVKQGKR